MSLLKSVAIPVGVVGAICGVLAATAPAEAYEYREGQIRGYQVEILESGSYDVRDFITVYGPRGKEEIIVRCAPYEWESTGPNTKDFVDSITRAWCF